MPKYKECAYCGKKPANTNDHVPPKSVLIEPYPENLLTVPACNNCNSTFGKHKDEQLKIYLAKMIVTYLSKPVSNYISDYLRKFLESARKTLEKNKKASKKLEDNVFPVLHDLYITKFDLQERQGHVSAIERIIKGLFYYKYKQILPKNYIVKVYDQLKTPIDSVFTKESISYKEIIISKEIFFARYTEATDNKLASLWELYFYGIYIVRAITWPSW